MPMATGTGQAVGFLDADHGSDPDAVQTGDCCDDAANINLAKLIHPGADFQSTSAGGICGGVTWDYDCNGVVGSNPQTISCNNDPANCMGGPVDYQESSCGGTHVSCGCSVAGPS